jgi:hypothetical protein
MHTLLSIGGALAGERRAAGISQRELAEQLGTSQQQIARWEASGYRTASLERVAAAAEALGLGVELPIAAEAPAAYGPAGSAAQAAPASPALAAPGGVTPVRDLGEIAARLREHYLELRDTYHFERIGVFGSFSSGEQTPESDVDLLVETSERPGVPWLQACDFIEGILGRRVDLVEPGLLKERIRPRVLREAIYVWEA